jgi:glycosyltransferase involved in cell wall biosynthesis
MGEPYEAIVVDDGSQDRTAAIARDEGAQVVGVNHRHIAATRNAGARAARGDRLVFIDADTRVNTEVIQAALEALRHGAVGGGCTVRFDEPLPRWARRLWPVLVAVSRAVCIAPGCFIFCTRGAFEAVGGFDETMYGAEEVAISQALKRHGKFVMLRETVLTSGRKMRAYSGREVLQFVGQLAVRGRRGVESRDLLHAWYGPRRDDAEGEQRSA